MSSHAPTNKKPNGNDRRVWQEFLECGYGCGRKIYHSAEDGRMFELGTEILHGMKRCKAILTRKQLKEHAKYDKTLRMEVVDEIRNKVLEQRHKGVSNPVQIMFEVLRVRKFKADAISIRELAMGFLPEYVKKDINGVTVPDDRAIRFIYRILNKLRDHEGNKSIVPYAQLFDNGEMLIFNLQTQGDWKPVRRRMEVHRDGVDEKIDKFDAVTASGTEARDANEKELEQAFAIEMVAKVNRKKATIAGGVN